MDKNKNKIEEKNMSELQKLDRDLEELITFSLIEQENLDKAGIQRRFRVSPFVGAYIQRKLTNACKIDYLKTV